MLVLYVPQTRSPSLILYSYGLLGVGVVLVLLNKGFEIIQYAKLKNAPVYCLDCGWQGLGRDWFRYHCCPECDSERVIRTSLTTIH